MSLACLDGCCLCISLVVEFSSYLPFFFIVFLLVYNHFLLATSFSLFLFYFFFHVVLIFQIMWLVDIFRAKIVDISDHSLTIEVIAMNPFSLVDFMF